MNSSALKYAHTIMGFFRVGQDKSKIAFLLWECCAVTAISYAVESMTLTKATVQELDKIQNMVARFILQLPKSAAPVAGFVDGEMKLISIRIH